MRLKCLDVRCGDPGNRILHEWLENGLPMGAMLRRFVDETPGQVWAMLPPGPKPENHADLTSEKAIRYGLTALGEHGLLDCLSERVREYIGEAVDHVWIVEDAMTRRGDHGLDALDLPKFFVEGHVYWRLGVDNMNDKDMIDTASFVIWDWGSIGILTSWVQGHPMVDKQELTTVDLNGLVARVQRIVVSAYDGEGYLIWCRGGWEGR